MHVPLGNDYFNVICFHVRKDRYFMPVIVNIVDRHALTCGSQEKIVGNIIGKGKEECPNLIVLTPTCTSSILQ
jgi:light-independent protochlorophyllide reductase subunit B